MNKAHLAAFAVLALTACKSDRPQTETQTLAERQHEENALAGYMVRLGYQRWAIACGHAMAKRGASRKDAIGHCSVDFHFTGPITGRP